MSAPVTLIPELSFTRGHSTRAVLYHADTRYQLTRPTQLYADASYTIRGSTTVPLLAEFAAAVQWLIADPIDWPTEIQKTYQIILHAPSTESVGVLNASLQTLQYLVCIYRNVKVEKLTGVKYYDDGEQHVCEIPTFQDQNESVKLARISIQASKDHAEYLKQQYIADTGRREADVRAQVLFRKTFPWLADEQEDPMFLSKLFRGITYVVDKQAELTSRHGLVRVMWNGKEQGRLCCVVDSRTDNTPGTDVLLQKCLLLTYDELQIWKFSNWFPSTKVTERVVRVDNKTKMPKLVGVYGA